MTASPSSGTTCSQSAVSSPQLLVACITLVRSLRLGRPCKSVQTKVPSLGASNFKTMTHNLVAASRDRFTDAVCGFISAVRLSQGLWLEGCSTYEDYTKRRIATVGVKPLLMVLQWSYGLSLPQSIYDHEATKAMFREVYIGVYLYNDLVSLKKEVVDGDVDSAIPIMVWQEGITAQEAVDRVVRMIETSWEGLLAAEQKLLKVAQTDQMRRDILQLVAGCKDIVVGHMAYTLRAARYMADATHDKFKAQGGSFKVVL